MQFIANKTENKSPNIDDSIEPNFKVFWINKSSGKRGHSTFFTYEYGFEIIKAVFDTMYPNRKILRIIEIAAPYS